MGVFARLRKLFEAKPMASLGFGPNRIVVEVRRLIRDPVTKEPILDESGNLQYDPNIEIYENYNITCGAGKDSAKDRLFNSATSQGTAHFIALSESALAPASTHTQLDAEITQSGLQRAAGTYDLTGCGVGECIVKNTFTATGSFSTVRLMGLFDAAGPPPAPEIYFEATFTAVALESGDQLTARWDKISVS